MRKKIALYLSLLLIILLLAGTAAFLYLDRTENDSETGSATTSASLKDPKIELSLVAKGLNNVTAIVSTRNASDKRLFVVERSGLVKIIEDGAVSETPFLDLRTKVEAEREMGLLGLAFHPTFENNGYFFVNYTNPEQKTIVARYKISNENQADPSSEKVLLEVAQPYRNHNGGDLAFGPDGYLYIPLGDGGSGGDPQNHAQNTNDFLGKILRIDVDNGDPYLIPKDNPFVDTPNTRAEIWASGLRNPWRISFDRENGNLWIGDVGQGTIEEIDFQRSGEGGKNYGWRCYEGSQDYVLGGCKDKSAYVFPVIEYPHTEERCSVTGGYVYRGQENRALVGKYFYADYCGGQIYTASENGGKWVDELVLKSNFKISTFGEDSSGELYLADFDGSGIYKITDSAN